MTMREILFRGKHSEKSRWDYGDLYIDHGKVYIGSRDIMHGVRVHGEVIPETVGQFTGLTDKNGTKIFEGDICRNTKTNEIVSVKWHGTMAGYVWSKRRADNGNLYDFGELFRAFDKYEVIGNIHDNPEMTEGN